MAKLLDLTKKAPENRNRSQLNIREISRKDIAIIGISCQFPDANNPEEFWSNLQHGKCSIKKFPENRRLDTDHFVALSGENPAEVVYADGGYLDRIDQFDPKFFAISPKEASLMDPHQRLFLEIAWKTLEDAGYGGERIIGERTGIYVGYSSDFGISYKLLVAEFVPSDLAFAVPGNLQSIIASRIAYLLDFKGPSMMVDTACSSSLTAVHLACRALRQGECELALAGGVRVKLIPLKGANAGIGISSADYRTRTFDDSSDGTGFGEGAAAILLKPLEDAIADHDHIYAVIKGSAVNQDGSSAGITAPNALAQADVIERAWTDARIDPKTITYIEAHGTGTRLGDPIEIDGISRAFRKYTQDRQFCGIGSVKSNLGHLDNAAGIAGLLKVILSLKHKMLVPTVNFQNPNRKINFADSPVFVVDQPQYWEVKDSPRRCGISAFGLSGTNCHLVLEEAPDLELPKRSGDAEEIQHLLALSTKSEETLQLLIQKYQKLLQDNPEINLGDLCYTANTGRWHYTNRVLIVFKDLNELQTRLAQLMLEQNHGYETGIFCGEYRIIAKNQSNRQLGEITDQMQKELTAEAKLILRELLKDRNNQKLITTLGQLYVRGAEIEWQKLYADDHYHKLSLPTFIFDHTRCWIQPEKLDSPSMTIEVKELTHPLLDRCLAESIDRDTFITEFSVSRMWELAEHKVSGNYVLPGTTYLEMVREAVKNILPTGSLEYRDVVFISPLVLTQEEVREVQTIIKKEDEHLAFVISSKLPNSSTGTLNWLKHAEGKLYPVEKREVRHELERLFLSCPEEIPYNNQRAGRVIELGPRWQNVRKIYLGEEKLLVRLELLEEYQSDQLSYVLHPALLDMAVNVASQSAGQGLFLPLSYGSFKLYDKMPTTVYSYLRWKGKDKNREKLETISFNIELLDSKGNLLAEICDYTIKKVHQKALKFGELARSGNYYHQVGWVEEEFSGAEGDLLAGAVLVFKDESDRAEELIAELATLDKTVIEVQFGLAYQKIDQYHYQITGSEDDYARLLAEIEIPLGYLLHLATVGLSADTLIEEQLNRGVYSLFHLARALSKSKTQQSLQIILVTDQLHLVTGGESVLNPVPATLVGFGKVVGQEIESLRCRVLDLDSLTDIRILLQEMSRPDQPYAVAYRANHRYVEEFRRINLAKLPALPIQIRHAGVYLLTGGLGGIGLEIGKYLASLNRVGESITIALLNRTPLPDRNSWDSVTDEDILKKIKAIYEMEREGVEVVCYSGDVANSDDLKMVIQELREDYGQINGIIHSAGVAGDGLIILKSLERFNEVLRPKVIGTYLLHMMTLDDELDFFINFSSINSLFGGAGQSDYTAANAYLDAFAYARELTGKRTLSINWPAWRETGMAVEYGVNMESGIFRGITTERALSIFDQLLTKDVTRIVIGELNYGNPIFRNYEHFPLKLDLETRTDLARWQRHTSGKALNTQPKTLKTVILHGRYIDEYSEMERKLGQIWGEVLGIEEVNVFEDFYELGGDSILAIKISNTIKEHLGLRIEISDLFEYLTITELAEYLSGQLLTLGGENQQSSQRTLDSENNLTVIEEELIQSQTLSNAQHRMWFLQKLEPEMTAYNLITTLPIEQEVNADVLDQALHVIIQRHSALRTVFTDDAGLPTQVVLPELDLRIQRIDLSNKDDQKQILQQMILADKEIPFDLSQPLLRVKLFKLTSQKYYLYYNIHHIITDGWSLKIFHQELLQIYEAYLRGHNIQLEPLQTSYLEWVREQERWSKTQEFAQLERYWLEELAKPLSVLNLPTDYPRPQKQTYKGSYLSFKVDQEQTLRLKELARQTNSTLFMTMLSLYVLLLNKLSGDQDIIIGSPITGRDDKQLERIMGLFINTIAIRVNFTDLVSITDLIDHVKTKSLQAYRHSRYPFDRLVTRLNPERDFSRSPIFSTMFQFYEEIPPANEGVSLFDLSFLSREVQGEIEVRLEYSTDLFKRESIQRIVKYYLNILRQIDQQVKIISEIQLLTDEEKRDILSTFSSLPEVEYADSTIIEGFRKQVVEYPDELAVICEEQSLTYTELDKRSTQLARLLLKEGVRFNEPVGIMLGRRIEMIVGMLGILKAGGVYVPLDPDYPVERLSYMLNHSETRFIITETGLLTQVQELIAEENHLEVCIDLTGGEVNPLTGIRGYSLHDLQGELTVPINVDYHPDHLMYIIYTSGSTGKPKGVMVTQRNALNFLNWSITDGCLGHADQMLLVTSMSFDISVFEIFGALLSGAKLNILTKERLMDPDSIIDYLINQKITIWHSVPTMMAQILLALKVRQKTQDIQLHLRRVMIGGEAWSSELAREIRQYIGDVEILNMYGPTEATIWVCSYSIGSDLSKTAILPIGKPLPNNRIVILDTALNLCGMNIPGDIYITGANVTNGYYKDELKTKDAFISIELEEGHGPVVLYRTGDVGRYLEDGNIEYLSRKDGMVKVRGYRIEVGEIENTLITLDEIQEVAVIAKPEGETQRLICYYTTRGIRESQNLKDYLAQKIPAYMIPAQFIELKEMPLTPNGKIDRKQLQALEISSRLEVENAYVAPTDEVQEFLASIWQELLGIDQIGINEKFFNIGGNSFLVSQMHAKIETRYPGSVNVADIFTYPTIASLAEYILNTADVTEVSSEVTTHNTDEELLKLISDMDSGELSIEDVLKNIELLEVEDE